jgi:hypothetical protein
MVGYRAWFYYAEKKADAAMELRLDKDQYDENDLVALEVPLYNPYQLEQKTFERVDGEISFEGTTYKFVKRRISEGKLILLCIPDTHKMVLKEAKTSYGNNVNDFMGNKKSPSKSTLQKNFNGNDYEDHQFSFQFFNFSISAPMQNEFSIAAISDPHIASPGKPPQDKT